MSANLGGSVASIASVSPDRVSPHYLKLGFWYLFTLLFLYVWEKESLPRLQDAGLLPCGEGALLPSDKRTKWILPSTADTPVPLPSLFSLLSLQPLYVGSRPGSRNTKTRQFIALKSSSPPPPQRRGMRSQRGVVLLLRSRNSDFQEKVIFTCHGGRSVIETGEGEIRDHIFFQSSSFALGARTKQMLEFSTPRG